MRQTPKSTLSTVLLSAVLLLALALAGCGSSSSATAKKDVPTIPFKSAAIQAKQIPVRYTCDGQNISPPLEWGTVPAGVQHLALFVVGFTPEPATKTFKISVDWAVAGLNPALHKLAAGHVPPGAFLGLTTSKQRHYSVCPVKGKTVQYQFELYGEPSSLSVNHHFAALPVLNALVGRSGATLTNAHGAFLATYKRG
jgi:phosphatidylethanolamine-binding protein (PEBP) family uncharacterized protein